MKRFRIEKLAGAPGPSMARPASRLLGKSTVVRTLLSTLSCLALGFSPLLAAPAPATNSVGAAASALSAFPSTFDLRLGKDPFFPKSRRMESGKALAPIPVVPLTLKGISGAKGKRLAIISNRTFEVGEVGEVRLNDRTVKVRCLEIRENSVLVEIDGVAEAKELHLNKHL